MKSGTKFKEIRFCLEEDRTHCYVLVETWAQDRLMSQGWYCKTFSLSAHIDEMLRELRMSWVLWLQESPDKKDSKEN